jgi:subtilisin-like proprotein convertase family protein
MRLWIIGFMLFFAFISLNAIQSSSGTVNLPITDHATTTSVINIPGVTPITDINIGINLTHTYDADLTITIIHGTTTVTLASQNGGSGDNFTNTIFDDEATASIVNSYAPFTGSYRPLLLLSAFDGANLQGDWTLSVYDNADGDTGTLLNWFVEFPGELPTAPTLTAPSSSLLIPAEQVTMSWNWGANTTSYDVYLGTTNPPTTMVVQNQPASGTTGSLTLNNVTPRSWLYWQVVARNAFGTTESRIGEFYTAVEHGNGTVSSPFQIATLTDLAWLAGCQRALSSYFIQTADIDASETRTWDGGLGFNPIGHSEHFTGHYDGQGHTISHLYINRPMSYVGLFRVISTGSVSNLTMSDVDIQGTENVGAIAAAIGQTTLTNCHSTGSIYATQWGGGLIGQAVEASTVINCSSACSVYAPNSIAGGLIGESWSSEVRTSSATGDVTSSYSAGGLIGSADNATIWDCYATGSVLTFTSGGGGLVGRAWATNIIRSYATGYVDDTYTTEVGGLIGATSVVSFTSCFWNTETSGIATSAGGDGLTSAQMRSPVIFLANNWDFTGEVANGTSDIWTIDPTQNYGFPYLSWQNLSTTMSPSVTSIDFGTMYFGQSVVSRTVTITNTGNRNNLLVYSIDLVSHAPGYLIEAPTLPFSIRPNQSVTITVRFTPPGVGVMSDVLCITTSSSNYPTLNIQLSASGYSVTPTAPQNTQAHISGDDMVLTWAPVTTSTTGLPMQVTGYAVLYSEAANADTDAYYFHGITSSTTYTHHDVAAFSNRMFYRVVAYMRTTSSRDDLNALQGRPWSEVKGILNQE